MEIIGEGEVHNSLVRVYQSLLWTYVLKYKMKGMGEHDGQKKKNTSIKKVSLVG